MPKRGNFHRNFKRGRGRGGRGNNRGNFRDNRGKGRQNFPRENVHIAKPEQLPEVDVGITEYINNLEGFYGLIKGRFSDFHVNEIDLEGNIAKLTDTKVPQGFQLPKIEPPVESPISAISEEKWKEICEMIESKDDAKLVKIECTGNKEDRSLIHKTLKQIYRNKIISNTQEEGDKKYIEIKLSSNKNTDTRSDWPSGVPIYTHFLLYKESIDTMNAIMTIGHALRMNSANFNYAGVKDRRAKTTQTVCVKKMDPTRLLYKTKFLRNIKIGNITFKDGPLKLGQLSGNLFRIALRDVTVDDEVIAKHMNHVKEHGFINYYGLQRFGNYKEIPTHLIGINLMQGNFQEACNLILKPRSYDNPNAEITQAKKIYEETQDAKKASENLSRDESLEAKLIMGLAYSGKNDYVNALESIPRNMRLLYIHAFQSYVWNLAVSKRIKDYGMKPIVGDLVLLTDKETEVINNDCKILECIEDEAAETEADQKSEDLEDVDMKRVEVKILGENDLDNYSIYDIVLPLPGYDVKYPENSLKDYYKEILEEYKLELEMPKQRVKTYTLSGNYRKIVERAEDITWKILQYREPNDNLIRSDFEEILGHKEPESDPDGKLKAVVLSFKLKPCSYATMVLREILRLDSSTQVNTTRSQKCSETTESEAKTTDETNQSAQESSLLHDKDKFAAFKKLIEDVDHEDDEETFVLPLKRSVDNDEGIANGKKQKLDVDEEEADEGIKIQPSLI